MPIVTIEREEGARIFTEEVAQAKRNHSPEWLKVHGTKGARRCNQLRNAQHGHTRSNAHFGDNFVGHNAADHHTDAANENRDHKQPPAQVHVREVAVVVQIGIVCKCLQQMRLKKKIGCQLEHQSE